MTIRSRSTLRSSVALFSAIVLAALGTTAFAVRHRPESHYLFVWASDSAKRASDFLVVLDVLRDSPTYGRVVATVSVGGAGGDAHHTEHEMPTSGVLLANDWASGRTYRIDLRDPTKPSLAGSFDGAGPFLHPHSFIRLDRAHILATFQYRGDSASAYGDTHGGHFTTGGLAELDPEGRLVRYAPASTPVDSAVRPYSLAIVPKLDRIVTTTTDMHGGGTASRTIQVWRLSDLTLLKTIVLPPGPHGNENAATAEPRLLDDGRTVLVNTFFCGLYRVTGLEGTDPSAEWVYSAHYERGQNCAVPVLFGKFWIQTVAADNALVTLDVSDPAHPREVARLTLDPGQVPHWISREPTGSRIVITGYAELRSLVLLADVDRVTGQVRLDSTFREIGAQSPGISFERWRWSNGLIGPANPHGAVFSRE